MRIGIIAMVRSGGKNLGDWISAETGYQYIHEPFLNKIPISSNKNLVVKYLSNEWFELKEKPQMDKWIGLVRHNHIECAISFVKALKINEWHKPYTLSNEFVNENKSEIEDTMEWVGKEYRKILTEIPQIELLITYEGIYNSGTDILPILNYLNITNPIYTHMLDSNNRLRKKVITKTLI
jgi:hypothetical protein